MPFRKLGLPDTTELVTANRALYRGLRMLSKLKKGTRLRVPISAVGVNRQSAAAASLRRPPPDSVAALAAAAIIISGGQGKVPYAARNPWVDAPVESAGRKRSHTSVDDRVGDQKRPQTAGPAGVSDAAGQPGSASTSHTVR